MELSVIIVNYNVRRFLESALTSVRRALEGIESEVFVVDNASDDGSAEMVRAKFPEVHLLENTRNLGFARANNLALAQARGRFLLLLNPDTLVQEDTFRVMLAFFRQTSDAGIAGCRILNPDGSFQLPCRRSFPTPWVAFTKTFGLSALFPKSHLFGQYNLTFLSDEATYPVDAVSGSFMMVRREAYEKVGGLDEDFFMYGEDLDWCYRVMQAGFRVYYVHTTKIIHFKGESTRRSDIDEIRLFYQAMQLFVRKHLSRSRPVLILLNLGIFVRETAASIARLRIPVLFALLDALLVVLAILAGEYLYFGEFFHFPARAYPSVWIAPAALIVLLSAAAGLYTMRRFALARAMGVVATGYIFISASVFFIKDFAFSRAVVLIAGFLTLCLLPGWRLGARLLGGHGGRKSLFGRRTVIVGTGPSAQEVLRRLRARVDDGYDVLGFIDTSRRRIGEKIAGIEVIGSVDNVAKVLDERRVGEVIFSTDGLPYEQILSVIAQSKNRSMNFRLVGGNLEAIIGKTRIDELDTLPLVDIDYNIHRLSHRFVKRLMDIVIAALLLVTVYPFVRLRRGVAGSSPLLLLPGVLRGQLSLVGLPIDKAPKDSAEGGAPKAYLGPEGLTGLVQLNERADLDEEERERYTLYYAKNQSLILDLEIIAKSLLARRTQTRRMSGGGRQWQK